MFQNLNEELSDSTVHTLIVIVGPTGVGKTNISIKLAKCLNAEIINADSRQIFRNIPIGTAAPTVSEQEQVKHHLVGCKDLTDYYSAALFEKDALNIINRRSIEKKSNFTILSGGSMMYIDAVCNGIDDIPTIREDIRLAMKQRLNEEGLSKLTDELKSLDYDYWKSVDKNNARRVVHALEIIHQTGNTYSSYRKEVKQMRSFNIVKIGINLPRKVLYQNIDNRVDAMISEGLIDEARGVYPFRELNSLKTVGYNELFDYFDNKISLEDAIGKIKTNTHEYARKQLTWFKKDNSICWFYANDYVELLNFIHSKTA